MATIRKQKGDCPECKQGSMLHLCYSHIPGTKQFKKNGWYCEMCKCGPYHLAHPQPL